MTVTKQQIQASLLAVKMLADAIREVGSVPSGHLYAMVMGVMDLATYTSMIGTLKHAGLVSERNHLLTWIGPEKPEVECQTCVGYGYIDKEGRPSLDRRDRKCLDCTGSGKK